MSSRRAEYRSLAFAAAVSGALLTPNSLAVAQNCGRVPTPPGVSQIGDWCAFACLEYVAEELFYDYYKQCDFVGEAAKTYWKPWAPNCISAFMACNTYECADYYLDGDELDIEMNIMGFLEFGGGDIHWYYPPNNPGQLTSALCDGDYLIAANWPLASEIGHAVVITYYDAATSTFIINNPNWDPALIPATFSELKTGTYAGGDGDMEGVLKVGKFSPAFLGIGDIGGFWYYADPTYCHGEQDYWGIQMCWRLNSGTSPADSMALYVADNPDGPARKVVTVKPLNAPPPDEGTVGHIYHYYPLADSACYYYWIDHGPGNFPQARDTKLHDLYPNSDSPVCYTWGYYHGGEQRDVLDAPNISQIVDPPANNGNELYVHWNLSTNDAVIDYYNVYREEEGSLAGFHWIGSTPRGTTSFRDTNVFPGLTYNYRVSAAHHGAGGGPVTSANRGIWNDFSEPVSATAINDFPIISSFVRKDGTAVLTPMPGAFAIGCPQGDEDEIVIEVEMGAPNGEEFCAPADALTLSQPLSGVGCQPCASSALVFYPDNVVIHADSATTFVPSDPLVSNAHCIATFTVRHFGGCALDSALVSAYGVPLGYAHVNVRSPDLVTEGLSRGKVLSNDFGKFSTCYEPLGHPYCECSDYVAPFGAVQLNDLAFFWAHYNHAAPAGGSAPQVEKQVASGAVLLEFEEVHPLIGEHKLLARIKLEGVEPFETAVLALRNDNPKLEFAGWTKSPELVGETLCAETVRDGHKEVFIGVVGEYSDNMGSSPVGTAEFRVFSDQELTLTDEDLALVVADVLSAEGEKTLPVSPLGARRITAPVVYKNELAQNFPNPFNPLTTIAFSLERSNDVSLSIYDVRGALVRELVDGRKERGVHRIVWDGMNANGQPIASGVYFYKLIAGSFTDTRKMTMLK